MTTILAAPSVLAADNAYAAGVVIGNLLVLALAVALVVFGVRFVRRPGAGTGRKVAGIVMIVLGVLFILGGLSSFAQAATSA